MKIITSIFIGLFLSITLISAMDITFFYSDNCPHCAEIKPLIFNLAKQNYKGHWNLYETSNPDNQLAFQNYGFTGVPAFVIKTLDCREIKFVGANIPKLNCELNEMTTKDCPTYSISEGTKNGSWFKK